MNEFENAEILEQVYFERYKNKVANDVLLLLEDANKKIANKIKQTSGIFTKKRYKEIRNFIKECSKELKEYVDEEIEVEEIIDYVLEKQSNILRDFGGLVDFTLPTTKQIMSGVLFKPIIPTKTYEAFLDTIDSQLYSVWDSAIRTGYITGQTTQQIVRDVLGSVAGIGKVIDYGTMQTLRNSIMANTRTALQSFANATRNEIFIKNEKYFNGYRWVATLDRRSCLVCGNLDGKVYDKISDAPEIPLHYNCRCLLIPIIDDLDWDDTRASENGQVDSKLSFEDWLNEQPPMVQKDILGTSRFEMYKSGTSFNSFVADNRVLTLDELKNK